MLFENKLRSIILGIVFLSLIGLSGLAQTQTTAPVTTIKLPKAQLSISHFGRPIQPGTVMASAHGGSAPAIPTFRVTAGDSFLFAWSFSTKHALTVSAKIIGGGQTTTLNPGTPVNRSKGWKNYRNQRNIRIRTAGEYTLRVTAMSRGGNTTKVKKVRFEVSGPELQNVKPRLNTDTRVVTFKVKNVGTASATGRFKVYYQIQAREPNRQLMQSNFTTESMTLRKNRTVSLGNVTVPERALQSKKLWIRVTVNLVGPVSKTTGQKDYNYTWPQKTLKITNDLLDLVAPIMTGQVVIDNYTNPSRDKVKNLPYKRDASSISLMGEDYNFNFSYMKYEVGFSYYFFVRNFRAEMGGDNFLTIENGKLCLNINFNCSSGREVKGWRRRPTFKDYSDDGCPDLDIQRFKIKVTVEPRLRGNKISYRNPVVSIDSRMRIPGGWSFLNGFKDRINRSVRDSVRSGFQSMLNGAAIRGMIENKLTEVVMNFGSALGIRDLVSVVGRGNEIIVTYR